MPTGPGSHLLSFSTRWLLLSSPLPSVPPARLLNSWGLNILAATISSSIHLLGSRSFRSPKSTSLHLLIPNRTVSSQASSRLARAQFLPNSRFRAKFSHATRSSQRRFFAQSYDKSSPRPQRRVKSNVVLRCPSAFFSTLQLFDPYVGRPNFELLPHRSCPPYIPDYDCISI